MNPESTMNCAIKNLQNGFATTTFGGNDTGEDIVKRCAKEGNEDFIVSCFSSTEAFEQFMAGESSLDKKLTSFSMEIDDESAITLDFTQPIVPQIRPQLKAMDDGDIVKFYLNAKMTVGSVQ